MSRCYLPISLLSLLIVAQAQASAVDLNRYTLIAGGFGKDGATGQPLPLKNSIANAKKIYASMDVSLNEKEKKAVGVAVDGDTFGIECDEVKCDVTVIVRDQKLPQIGWDKDIHFTGKIAQNVFEALPQSSEQSRVGATVRSVANLSCARVVAPGRPVNCTVKNMNYSSGSLAAMEEQGMPRKQIEALIKAIGLDD